MRRSLSWAGALLLALACAWVGSHHPRLRRAAPASELAEGAVLGGFAEGAAPGESAAWATPDGSGAGQVVFEPNQGQVAAGTEFVSRGGGYALHLRPGEAVLALRPAPASAFRSSAAPHLPEKPQELSMRLVGGNLDAEIVGIQPLLGHSNYLLGNDSDAWLTRVPHYAAVRYRDAYPGIDLVFYGPGGQLEYDFIVGAQSDPAAIRFELGGAEKIFIDRAGNLVLQVGGREISQSAPRAYQNDTVAKEVEARFVLYSDEASGPSVGFEVGAYDAGVPLVIDPAVGFSTFLGGSDAEEMPHVAVDRQANVYVAGTTASIDFPRVHAGSGVGVADAAGPNAFVTKLSADGSTILYSTYFGGSGADRANGIAVDNEGNAYLTGQTESPDFPTRGALQAELNGSTDAFVAKLSADGAGLIYSSYFGGSGTEAGMGVAIDDQGSVYLTGQTSSMDLPTVGAVQGSLGGASDGFAGKISPDGDVLVYSTYLGGAVANDGGLSIAVDDAGNAYVTGITESDDFPLVNALQPDFGGGGTDAFVSKLDESGAALSYSTFLGGSGAEAGLSIAVDIAGQAYLAGQTTSADFPTHRSLQTLLVASPDAFLAKLAATGEGLVYSTYLGGSGADVAAGVAVDQSSKVHLVGMTSSADFPLADPLQPQLGGGADAFVLRLDDLGSELSYSTFLGGTGNDAGVGVALDGAGNALVAGQTGSPDFPQLNATQGAHGGVQDAFVARFCLALVFERNEVISSVGGRGRVRVFTSADCAWTAVSTEPWISISAGETGVGEGTVSYTVQANRTGRQRAGTLIIAGQVFTVFDWLRDEDY